MYNYLTRVLGKEAVTRDGNNTIRYLESKKAKELEFYFCYDFDQDNKL